MAYQRGSYVEPRTLAERFKSLLRMYAPRVGVSLVTRGIGYGLGLGTLSGAAVGLGAQALLRSIEAPTKPRKKVRRVQNGTSRVSKVRPPRKTSRIKRAAKAVGAKITKTAKTEAQKLLVQATRQAVNEGYKVGTKAFGAFVRNEIARLRSR